MWAVLYDDGMSLTTASERIARSLAEAERQRGRHVTVRRLDDVETHPGGMDKLARPPGRARGDGPVRPRGTDEPSVPGPSRAVGGADSMPEPGSIRPAEQFARPEPISEPEPALPPEPAPAAEPEPPESLESTHTPEHPEPLPAAEPASEGRPPEPALAPELTQVLGSTQAVWPTQAAEPASVPDPASEPEPARPPALTRRRRLLLYALAAACIVVAAALVDHWGVLPRVGANTSSSTTQVGGPAHRSQLLPPLNQPPVMHFSNAVNATSTPAEPSAQPTSLAAELSGAQNSAARPDGSPTSAISPQSATGESSGRGLSTIAGGG
jgi:hypothetical protein